MHLRRVALPLTLLLLLVLAAPAAALAQESRTIRDHELCRDRDRDRDRDEYCEVRELRLEPGALEVDGGGNGGIRVEGWDRDEILVEARISARADSVAEAEELAGRVSIDVDGRRLHAEGPSTRGERGWWTSFRVYVPRDTDLELRTSNGGISIEAVSSRMRFRTSNGGVSLTDVGGDVEGETSNGGVTVRLGGERWEGSGLDVHTSNGGVRLYVPEGYSARLETGTVNGSVEIDFPVTLQGRLDGDIEVDLGEGGAPVRVRTTNGGVRIQRSGS